VLQHIRVPRFSREDPIHRHLASASGKAHGAIRNDDREQLRRAEAAIDRWAARLWDLEERDLEEMREFLRELGLPAGIAPR